MTKPIIIAIIIVLLVGAGLYLYFTNSTQSLTAPTGQTDVTTQTTQQNGALCADICQESCSDFAGDEQNDCVTTCAAYCEEGY